MPVWSHDITRLHAPVKANAGSAADRKRLFFKFSRGHFTLGKTPHPQPTPLIEETFPTKRLMTYPLTRSASSKQRACLFVTSAILLCHGHISAAPVTANQKAPVLVAKENGDPVGDLNGKEVQKREANRERAQREMERGEKAMALEQYEMAVQCFGNALGLLPKGPMVSKQRQAAMQGFGDASLRLAEVRISEGYAKSRPGQTVPSAEDIVDNALVFDPANKAAQRLKQKLNTPGYYNTAITPEFRGDVEKVKRLLLEGQNFREAGRFDLAIKRGDQVLEIDPYNSAARKLQEEANVAIKTAAESGSNEARSRAFRDLEKAWSNSVKHYGNSQISSTDRQIVDASKVEKLRLKIDRLILPEIQFTDTPITQVADILTRAAQGADSGEHGSGVLILANFAANSSNSGPQSTAPKTSILDLSPPASNERAQGAVVVTTPKIPGGFSLREILDMVTSLVDVKWVIKENRVEIVPKGTPTDVLVIRHWTVSPFLFSSKAARVDELSSVGGGANILGSGNAGTSKQGNKRRIDPKEFLSDMNVRFDVAGSTATFNPRNRELTVYNTVEMLDLVDSIVANSEGQAPVQVDIRAKFVEFTQSNLKELSFDWLLGPSNVPGNSKVFTAGGGTPDASNFPFGDPDTGQRTGRGPLTGGNRSGAGAIAANAIDGLLSPAIAGFGGTNPAALAIAGAFTDPQFQVLVRALNQRKDVDLLSSPSITARDQEEASIDIVREFRYPTEFTPPQIPQQIGNTGASGLGASATLIVPVTPTTPTAFEKRDTGVKLRVTPSIKGDNYAIDLELHPEVTEFEGFINYGSPILAGGQKLTENVINQPIFAVRRLQTTVTLLDGETIALGGLMREDVQKVNDKVPILGDIPLVGRLFRSNVDQHLKKNLTIFVTARIIDASGQPLKASKAESEIEEVPPLTTNGVLGMAR